MISRLNKLEIALNLLEASPKLLNSEGFVTQEQPVTKLQLKETITNLHESIKFVIDFVKEGRTSILEEKLSDCFEKQVKLRGELALLQGCSLTKLCDLIEELERKSCPWKVLQAEFLVNFIETINLKMIAIQEDCVRKTYDATKSTRLLKISEEINSSLNDEEEQLRLLQAELCKLRSLPNHITVLYAEIQSEISKYEDYFGRLE